MEYTARATADGNGRNGRVTSHDGLIDLKLGIPPELGGAGGGSNPEQLFAAGYAGCFMSAVGTVARERKVKLTDPSVTAAVTIAHGDDGLLQLSVELTIALPGVDLSEAHAVVEGAHRRCPYSKAVHGNVPVKMRVLVRPPDAVARQESQAAH